MTIKGPSRNIPYVKLIGDNKYIDYNGGYQKNRSILKYWEIIEDFDDYYSGTGPYNEFDSVTISNGRVDTQASTLDLILNGTSSPRTITVQSSYFDVYPGFPYVVETLLSTIKVNNGSSSPKMYLSIRWFKIIFDKTINDTYWVFQYTDIDGNTTNIITNIKFENNINDWVGSTLYLKIINDLEYIYVYINNSELCKLGDKELGTNWQSYLEFANLTIYNYDEEITANRYDLMVDFIHIISERFMDGL